MRAAVFRSGRIVAGEVADPELEPGEVLVETVACGICGSDLHMVEHGASLIQASREAGMTDFSMDLDRDVVLGHEFCAEIVEHGPETEGAVPVGSRVCAMPIGLRHGDVATVGYSNDLPGGFGTHMALREPLLVAVPNGLEPGLAAMTEPMAVGRHAAEMARLEVGDVPLVVGCGPVGLAVIAALRQRGARPIVASDFSPRRRELAERMGADVVIDPGDASALEAWAAASQAAAERRPVEPPPDQLRFLPASPALRPAVVFECVGVPGMLDSLMREAPRGTKLVVVGVCMEPDRVHPVYGINKELSLQFVLGYTPAEFADTLRGIAEGELDVEPLITGRVGVEGVAEAFEELKDPERHAKILVEPWR